MKDEFILNVRNLSKNYGEKTVFDNINFDVKKNSVFSIVSPSGKGKSTLAKIILGLEEPDSGYIKYKGKKIKQWIKQDEKSFRRQVQIVLQNSSSSFNPKHKVDFILKEPFKIHNIEYSGNKIIKALSEVGLQEKYLNRLTDEMSGGQRQRIAIARLLLLDPELVVMDEVLRGLDISLQAQIIKLILQVKEKHKLSLIFISHNKEIVKYISDKIFEL